MTLQPDGSLLERRLVIVTGKGGTGKTTVSAALALMAARDGRRVAVTEVGRDEHLRALLAPGSPPVGYAGRELQPGLTVFHIDPFEALAEYLGLQIGMRGLVNRGLRNPVFRQLMEGSPGWRELITLGKIWHLQQLEDARGKRLYDLVVVDAPATGHGVTFLDVPRVVRSAVRAGPLSRHSGLVETMILDQANSLLLPVALAEELPARETATLVSRVRDEIGMAIDRVVVNAVARAPFPPEMSDLPAKLAALPPETPTGGLPPVAVLAECASVRRSRYELNRDYVGQIARDCSLPVVQLPNITGGISGPDDLLQLGRELLAPPRRGEDAEATTAPGEAREQAS
ncbi:MAG: hypothetical protein JRH19_00710 [Deltaproteobacteria bacterium]|nr:hypothetical protein [Deltaproteobacteria bacterium]